MSDVNEFNVETQEFIIRPYSKEEKDLIEELKNKDLSAYQKTITIELTEQQINDIQTLVNLGLSEENAKRIIGIA